jgi:choline dehydrogenase-like flavoprotein
MSSDPTKGVVDANLKVHSLDNLYVAGSSVFATAGISNPTFTIITLSIRLAEHLSKTLGS